MSVSFLMRITQLLITAVIGVSGSVAPPRRRPPCGKSWGLSDGLIEDVVYKFLIAHVGYMLDHGVPQESFPLDTFKPYEWGVLAALAGEVYYETELEKAISKNLRAVFQDFRDGLHKVAEPFHIDSNIDRVFENRSFKYQFQTPLRRAIHNMYTRLGDRDYEGALRKYMEWQTSNVVSFGGPSNRLVESDYTRKELIELAQLGMDRNGKHFWIVGHKLVPSSMDHLDSDSFFEMYLYPLREWVTTKVVGWDGTLGEDGEDSY